MVSREIKFRAWDKKRKTMWEVDCLNWYDEYMWVNESPMSGYRLPVDSTPIMQYTGLVDRHGVEIYEGDIVKDLTTKTYLGGKKITSRIGQVKYGDYYAASEDPYYSADITGFHIDGDVFSSNLKDYFDKELEVIGNIYETPEVMERKK